MKFTAAAYRAALVLSCVLLAGIQLAFLPLPGIQQDEALFVFPYLKYLPATYSWQIAGHDLPIMLMDYNGALKTWLYWPLFQMTPPSVWSLRLPVCAISVLTLLIFANVAKRVCGPATAAIAALLLATDAPFLLANIFDWGPVSLLLLAAVTFVNWMHRFFESGRTIFFAAACLCVGLACWNKAIFVFPLAAMTLAAVILFPKVIRAQFSVKNLGIALLALCVGAFPLIAFNVHHAGATFKASQTLSSGSISEKLLMLQRTFDGRALEHYMFRSVPGETIPLHGASLEDLVQQWYATSQLRPGSALLPAMILALLSLPFLRGSVFFKPVAFAWIALLTAILAMLSFRAAGAGPHHTVLLDPAPQFLIAATAAGLATRSRAWRWSALAITIVVIVSNFLLLGQYYRAGRDNGFSVYWSDGIPAVAQFLLAAGKPVVFTDWGIQGGAQIETRDRLQVSHDTSPREGVLFVTHCPPFVLEPERNSQPSSPSTTRVITDRQGAPVFCVIAHSGE